MGLLDFTRATYPGYEPAPHHRLIIEKLEAVERGQIKRLMLFLPPRHGKSELASVRFPAWFLGRDPRRKVILASYGAVLAYKFSRRVRNLVRSPLYGRLYPGIELTGDAAAVAFWAWNHRRRGGGGLQRRRRGRGHHGRGLRPADRRRPGQGRQGGPEPDGAGRRLRVVLVDGLHPPGPARRTPSW